MATIPGVNQPSSPQPGVAAGGQLPVTDCSVKSIYNSLLNHGFSTIQAIGALANAQNESSFNPEIGCHPDVGGTACGLWQWNTLGGYSPPAATGNCPNDINSQVAYLVKTVQSSALAGSTATEVAGNFAKNFEDCVECGAANSSGNSQLISRQNNVAAIQQAVTSGNWANVAQGTVGGGGGGGAGGGGGGVTTVSASGDTCIVGFSGIPGTSWISDIFASGGNIGAACILSKTEARAVIGGVLMAVGAGFAMLSLILATGAALARTPPAVSKTGEAVGAGLALVPGLEGVGAAVAVGSKGVNAASQRVQERRQTRVRIRQQEAATRVRREPENSETVRETRREPLSGEMGGTRTTTTVRRVQGGANTSPASGRHARPEEKRRLRRAA